MARPVRQLVQIAGTLILAGLVLVGCVGPDAPPEEEPAAPPSDEVEAYAPLPPGVTAQGVVLASLLLASGDIERAVEAALVSPEEVELARDAIEAGTLQEWIDWASSE